MKEVIIKDAKGKVLERHPIDNHVIEWAARITAESHNLEYPAKPWTVEIIPDEIAVAVEDSADAT